MTRLIQGENTIKEIAFEIRKAGYRNVFLVCGKHLNIENDLAFLQEFNVTYFIKSGSNVDEAEGKIAVEQFSKDNTQAIVAIGGGSVIDLAKYIIYQLSTSFIPIPFFIVAPTTAGSGSEATHFAVIYKGQKKISLVHPSLLPQLVILDSQLTNSLTPYQTAVSGIDVLAQAIESYWNINATIESKKYASEAIVKWKESFIKVVTDPDSTAREGILLAAYLAGKAINITRTTGPHALSYYLTATFNIPHGQAVGIFLPLFFYYNAPSADLLELLGVKDANAAALMIQANMKLAGLAISFQELRLEKKGIIEPLLDEVNEERFANNPTKFDRDKLEKLMKDHL